MDLNNILVLVSAVVVVVVIWLFVGHRQLRFLRGQVGRAWEKVDEKYRKRHDLVPNLVETVRRYGEGQEALIGELIGARALAAREYVVGVAGVPGAKKAEYEVAFAALVERLLAVGAGGELAKDTNFLELRREINDLNGEIEKLLGEYRAAIEKYMTLHGRAFMAPVAVIFRHGKI